MLLLDGTPVEGVQLFDIVTKGGAMGLLAALLIFLARAVPKHVSGLQSSFNTAIDKLCAEQLKERELVAERAEKDRQFAIDQMRMEREACDKRIESDRQLTNARFGELVTVRSKQTEILEKQAEALTKLAERLPGKGTG